MQGNLNKSQSCVMMHKEIEPIKVKHADKGGTTECIELITFSKKINCIFLSSLQHFDKGLERYRRNTGDLIMNIKHLVSSMVKNSQIFGTVQNCCSTLVTFKKHNEMGCLSKKTAW